MTWPYFPQNDDPSERPLLNEEIGVFSTAHDLQVGQPSPGLDSGRARSKRNSRAVVIFAVMGVAVVAAVVTAGFYAMSRVDLHGDSWQVADSPSALDPEYPPEITDLAGLTAVPGETIEAADITWDTELIGGEDISPGIYVARDAGSTSDPDSVLCYWNVENHEYGHPDRFGMYARIQDGTAMALVPAGYRFEPSPLCGSWEAVDPATVFTDATGTVMNAELYVVGHDVMPGLYLSQTPVATDSSCLVIVNKYFGFEGGRHHGEFVFGGGGSIGLEVEPGDFVTVHECPPLQWTDPATAYSADAGATSVGVGSWIVGIDMRPGTYTRVPGQTDESVLCWAEVWDGPSDWEDTEPIALAQYFTDDEPATFTAELGQRVYAHNCGTWELVAP